MKTQKIIAALTAVVLATTPVMPVSAAQLTDVTPNNSTEVKANIVNPGSISYVITIPPTADFGPLTQPESADTDHYTFCGFQVEATQLNILSNQGVAVFIKDGSATDNQFYIAQKDAEDPFKIAYDVYDTAVNEETIVNYNPMNETATPGTYGYHLCTFFYGSQVSTQDVTLALNQNALCNQSLFDIAGDYSGTLTFHSALIQN